ncbi:hypothetical protein, partial [Helicobacter bizzozeronii]|uniref:hypothetical protein n=1 Tax=Helicobacter bizzozeronii TaxID=56877 RepID=UPI001F406A12
MIKRLPYFETGTGTIACVISSRDGVGWMRVSCAEQMIIGYQEEIKNCRAETSPTFQESHTHLFCCDCGVLLPCEQPPPPP